MYWWKIFNESLNGTIFKVEKKLNSIESNSKFKIFCKMIKHRVNDKLLSIYIYIYIYVYILCVWVCTSGKNAYALIKKYFTYQYIRPIVDYIFQVMYIF